MAALKLQILIYLWCNFLAIFQRFGRLDTCSRKIPNDYLIHVYNNTFIPSFTHNNYNTCITRTLGHTVILNIQVHIHVSIKHEINWVELRKLWQCCLFPTVINILHKQEKQAISSAYTFAGEFVSGYQGHDGWSTMSALEGEITARQGLDQILTIVRSQRVTKLDGSYCKIVTTINSPKQNNKTTNRAWNLSLPLT